MNCSQQTPFIGAALLCVFLVSGCLYDANDRCGRHEVFDTLSGRCVCQPGTTDDGKVCVATKDAGVQDAGDDDAGHGDASSSPTIPTGQGETCSVQKDCVGFEASYCLNTPMGSACLVPDCMKSGCAPGATCTDLSSYFPDAPWLCIPGMM